MQEEISQYLPLDFSQESRVWIFQSNRAFTEQEATIIKGQLADFCKQWRSHGRSVKGWGDVLFQRFVVMMADEDVRHVGGCSTDTMMRMIQEFETRFSITLLDRMLLTFLVDGHPQPLPYAQVKYALAEGHIETDTLLFDSTVQTLQGLQTKWLVPLNQSWLWSRIAN